MVKTLNCKTAATESSPRRIVTGEVTGMLFELWNHEALGMLVSPEINSDTVQVRLNSDPATGLPDRLMLTEMIFSGTKKQGEE